MDGEEIWCLIDGDTVPFAVTAGTSFTVDNLKEMVKQRQALHDVAVSSLVLWQLNEPEPMGPYDSLAERIRQKGKVTDIATKLFPAQEVSTLFPQHPPKGCVHIFVQILPTTFRKHLYSSPAEDDDREAKRKRTAPYEAIEMLSHDHPLHKLWMHAREPQTELFETRQVERDISGTKLPSQYTMLKGERWVQKLHPGSTFTDILIRDEYKEALRAITEWFLHEKVVTEGIVEGDDEGDDTMEGDNTPLENPFLDVLTGPMLKTGAFILLGHPGIGKTVFLDVLLVLRLQAQLPTIYQSRDTRLYYFDNNGVSRIKLTPEVLAAEFDFQFGPSTWCLIDSNESLSKVPVFIQDLDLFIVQASSPRPERFNWKDKAGRPVLEYFMKTWTPSELLVGRVLQRRPPSAAEIILFSKHYGNSARSVYTYASNPENYEKPFLRKMGSLTYETLNSLVKQASALDLSAPISPYIVLISPGTSRNAFTTSFPSRYIYEKIRDKFSTKKLEAVTRLYEIFVRVPGAAGLMLEDAVHDVFPQGGEWSLVSMKRSSRKGPKNTCWKSPEGPTSPQYLHLGFEKHHIAIDTNPKPVGTKYDPLELVPYLHNDLGLQLRDGYYLPASPSEATFDAFIYESASKTATVFQVTVSNTHSVKEGGIKWLLGLGVKNFRYIAVSTPDTLDLPFPNKLDALIPEKYLLIVESLPTHID